MKCLRISIITALYICLVLLHASCVREDIGNCMQYELEIQVVDAEGNDLTQSGTLEKSDVYLFNEKGFVRMVPAGVSSSFLFGHDKSERLTLVAWGNIKEDTLITTEITPGTPIGEAHLKLRRHAEGSHMPVTDIFYSRKELSNAATTRGMQEESITLVLERIVAGVSIRTRYMAKRYPYEGKPYTLIVRGAGTEMDFKGTKVGENAGYRPYSTTDEAGDVYAPPFRIFPTGEGERIEVDIYREDEKICTITEDNDAKPLCAIAGKQTNIDIDFRYAEIRTFVEVLPWGEVKQDIEM